MMISPFSYKESQKEKTYKELLIEREELLKEIYSFENSEDDDEMIIEAPSPDVVYQMNLQYLGELCNLISEKYNKEYVWKRFDLT